MVVEAAGAPRAGGRAEEQPWKPPTLLHLSFVVVPYTFLVIFVMTFTSSSKSRLFIIKGYRHKLHEQKAERDSLRY